MRAFIHRLSWLIVLVLITPAVGLAQVVLFDTSHGQNKRIGDGYNRTYGTGTFTVRTDSTKLTPTLLATVQGLILFSPTQPLTPDEKEAVVSFLKAGGRLLLIIDEERRTPLNGINDIILPFGMELTGNTPVPHNCGAVAEPGEICAERRELPYSGGRSITGGTVISRVYTDGDYVHSAWTTTPSGRKIVVMSDGMNGLLLGGADVIRLQGTSPQDTTYWGKDSEVFMKEVLSFLMKP